MSKQYNIMTTCTVGTVDRVTVGLTSVVQNLKGAKLDFFLLYNGVDSDSLEKFDKLCKSLGDEGQITFHGVEITDLAPYEELAKYGGGAGREAYYPVAAHLLLPEDVDRVMYLELSDTIVTGDISPYYNYGFNDASLIVTGANYFSLAGGKDARPFTKDDMADRRNCLPQILRGVFNSGSYVMNLKKMRDEGHTLDEYVTIAKNMSDSLAGRRDVYTGVQGLLSLIFVGDIQYYFFTDVKNVFFMPYNFCLWFYNNFQARPPYDICVVRFSGTAFMPWQGKYPIHLDRYQTSNATLHSLKELKDNQAEYFYMWHEYAVIADKALREIGY